MLSVIPCDLSQLLRCQQNTRDSTIEPEGLAVEQEVGKHSPLPFLAAAPNAIHVICRHIILPVYYLLPESEALVASLRYSRISYATKLLSHQGQQGLPMTLARMSEEGFPSEVSLTVFCCLLCSTSVVDRDY